MEKRSRKSNWKITAKLWGLSLVLLCALALYASEGSTKSSSSCETCLLANEVTKEQQMVETIMSESDESEEGGEPEEGAKEEAKEKEGEKADEDAEEIGQEQDELEAIGFHEGDFLLSMAPGIYEEPFRLYVSIPSFPDAVIYYTIDGNIPNPGEDRAIQRGEKNIQVSGRVSTDGGLDVVDRSGPWRESILTYHSEQWHQRIIPAEEAEILQGTAFRFQGFVDGEAVTEVISATYIIVPDASARFGNRPIVAITAPYEDFFYIYYHATPREEITRRRIFNYEFFSYEGEYVRQFSILGSSQLGGTGTRRNAQRTINVHLARGDLEGVVTYPIFPGLYQLYRFRLWNAGNAFHWDHMRDPFAQTASANLQVPFADNNVAIKFVNGEYWGFTTFREHTSNAHFVFTRLGIDFDNIAIVDRSWEPGADGTRFFDEVEEGDEDIVWELYDELVDFATTHNLAEDYARERLFTEFFCQDNFIDYLIANTFFNNADWPQNNVRFFRAIVPDLDSDNPYNDGRWRFIFHDMDMAPHPGERRYDESRFGFLYYRLYRMPVFNEVFKVFNNPIFVKQFVERALYLLEQDYHPERLLALHKEFTMRYLPLLPEMYKRFPIHGTVENSLENFQDRNLHLRTFLLNRDSYYREILAGLLMRLGLNSH